MRSLIPNRLIAAIKQGHLNLKFDKSTMNKQSHCVILLEPHLTVSTDTKNKTQKIKQNPFAAAQTVLNIC